MNVERTRDRVADYLREVERWTPAGDTQRARILAEAEAHLREAEAAGDLDGALERLGAPREAVKIFGAGRTLSIASRTRRVVGAVIDYGTLLAPIPILGRAIHGDWLWLEAGCTRRQPCPATQHWISIAVLVGALFYFAVVLTMLEWRYGRTPGKLLAGTRVVTEDGTAPSLGQVVIRRLPLVFSGVLQVIDWLFALRPPRHQRAFDVLAKTVVVRARTR